MFKNNLVNRESLSLKELSLSYIELISKVTKSELDRDIENLDNLYSKIDECKVKLSKCFDKHSDGLIDLYSAYLMERMRGPSLRNYAFIRENGDIYLHSFITADSKIVAITYYNGGYYFNTFKEMPILSDFEIGEPFDCLAFDFNRLSVSDLIDDYSYNNYKLKIKTKPNINIQTLIQFVNGLNNCISYVSLEQSNIVLTLPKNLSNKSIDYLSSILRVPKTISFKIKQDFLKL